MAAGPVESMLAEVHRSVVQDGSRAGDWLTGAQRIAAWHEARDARTNPLDRARRDALSPNAVEGSHRGTADLPAAAVEVVHRVSSDPGRLTRAWAEPMISELGEEVYAELVGVTAIATVVDSYSECLAGDLLELPLGGTDEPGRQRPPDVGDVGAWVSQTIEKQRANVSRTLSLVPVTQTSWHRLVDSHYSRGDEFFGVSWERALSRPQVELLAARVTALDECFY